MAETDQRAAATLLDATQDDPVIRGQFVFLFERASLPPEYDECERLSLLHGTRLMEIVAAHGWPSTDLVGEDGATAAWRIAQHLDSDNASRRLLLEQLRSAVEFGTASAEHLAALTDRIELTEGRLQVYGTHLTDVDGPKRPVVGVADPDNLDARRAALGLARWIEYAAP